MYEYYPSTTVCSSRITAATVRQKPRITGDQFIVDIIEEPVKWWFANFIKCSEPCYVGKPRGKVAYLTNSIPKWYNAASQSVGKALDITTPGQ